MSHGPLKLYRMSLCIAQYHFRETDGASIHDDGVVAEISCSRKGQGHASIMRQAAKRNVGIWLEFVRVFLVVGFASANVYLTRCATRQIAQESVYPMVHQPDFHGVGTYIQIPNTVTLHLAIYVYHMCIWAQSMVVGIAIDDHLLILAIETRARIDVAHERAIDTAVEHLYISLEHWIAEHAVALCPTCYGTAKIDGFMYISERAEKIIEVDILQFGIDTVRLKWRNKAVGVNHLLAR